ncbi:MAG: precorrin-6Y C5,15-methyltransferase [Candidatus Magnetoglobus multicellularis str. Araruama]|uniref:Precorrin-6Y C5,15-methyltransferase n=1 Tax=Candidatus Magnetoglobus multicellularis str. Araruama TaxID=890399 RepID=A0A1V1P516_9BACT|nr:MAG: precorrin-6Y C5,15-methyltransferase [Candidatus Magnetoglobus multicellularis str. Araruama]
MGAENVCFYPNISSIAAAFSKIKTPWHDAQVISLHGRGDLNDVVKSIHLHKKLAIMTSPEHTPAHIAKMLLKEINGSVQFFVFERMGLSDETFDHYQLNQAANKTFLEPNLVVCIGHGNTQKRSQLSSCNVYLGMPNSCYIHEKNMITKAEVRVVSLSKLCLQSDHVLWDLGAGCGSVAIEASFFITTGKIVALEKNSRRISHIKQNKNKFHVHQLEIVQAVMPDGISDLPAPDRIFIGGGGENLAEIIAMADGCLQPEGIIVINTVLIESLSEACFSLEKLGFEVDVTQVQISKSKKCPLEIAWPLKIQSGSLLVNTE